MNVNFSILTCVALLLITEAECQEIESPNACPSRPNSVLIDQFNGHLIRSANRIDLVIRQMLSGRQFRFSVGRYWIDQNESLIDEIDREVGIWGIDAPTDLSRR